MKTLLPSAIVSFMALASATQAAEVTDLNDSTVNGLPSTPVPQFLAGESTAAWLTASCTGDIVAAQVYWASTIPGAPPQLEQSVSIFAAGAHPIPGSLMTNQGGAGAVVLGPTLIEGTMNEYRFLDPPSNATALSVPVVAGQQYVVSLEFLNQSSGGGPFVPAPTIDQDGCQPLKNAAFVIPGGWFDACPLGVTGDWIIRAVIDCSPEDPTPTPAASDWTTAIIVATLAAVGLLATEGFARARDPQS